MADTDTKPKPEEEKTPLVTESTEEEKQKKKKNKKKKPVRKIKCMFTDLTSTCGDCTYTYISSINDDSIRYRVVVLC